MADLRVGVQCGRCGSGAVYMVTCNSFYGTGHDWVLASLCDGCRHVSWTEERCLSCDGREPTEEDEMDSIQQWADAHGLTRDQAEKLGVTVTDEGLHVPLPPHRWAEALR